MAQITSKYLGKYTEKISNSELAQIFFQTLDSQALLSASITIGGTTYGADTNTVADVLQALSGSGSGAKYALRRTDTAVSSNPIDLPADSNSASHYALLEQVFVNGVEKWKCVYSVAIDNYSLNVSSDATSGISGSITSSNNILSLNSNLTGTKSKIKIESVPKAEKILTSVAIGNNTKPVYVKADGTIVAVANPLATQQALEDAIAGVTKAYVIDSSASHTGTANITSDFIVQKIGVDQKTKDVLFVSDSYFDSTNSGSIKYKDINIGDNIYITGEKDYDWFVSNKVGSTSTAGTITITSIEADKPDVTGMVTTSDTLTSNHIILGNDNKTVKDSGVTIRSSGSMSDSSTVIPTENVIKTYVGDNDKYVIPVATSAPNRIKIGTGMVGSTATTDYDLYVPTGTSANDVALGNHVHGNISSSGTITQSATIASGDKLVIAHSSSGIITTANIPFGSSSTQALGNNGTWVELLQGVQPIEGANGSSTSANKWYSAFRVNNNGQITNAGYQIAYFNDGIEPEDPNVNYNDGIVADNYLQLIPNGGTVIILSSTTVSINLKNQTGSALYYGAVPSRFAATSDTPLNLANGGSASVTSTTGMWFRVASSSAQFKNPTAVNEVVDTFIGKNLDGKVATVTKETSPNHLVVTITNS